MSLRGEDPTSGCHESGRGPAEPRRGSAEPRRGPPEPRRGIADPRRCEGSGSRKPLGAGGGPEGLELSPAYTGSKLPTPSVPRRTRGGVWNFRPPIPGQSSQPPPSLVEPGGVGSFRPPIRGQRSQPPPSLVETVAHSEPRPRPERTAARLAPGPGARTDRRPRPRPTLARQPPPPPPYVVNARYSALALPPVSSATAWAAGRGLAPAATRRRS
jgi:hypothetical protein